MPQFSSFPKSSTLTTLLDQPAFGGQIPRPAAMGTRTMGQFGGNPGGGGPAPLWSHNPLQPHVSSQNPTPVRQPFVASERSLATSERANSAQEVEELLGSQGRRASYQGGWAGMGQAQKQRSEQYNFGFVLKLNVLGPYTVFGSSSGKRPSGTFRPGGGSK